VTEDEIRSLVIGKLGAIAPEADFDQLDPQEDLREALDLDSMDFLNLITALHQETGVDIPETDYSDLASLDDITAYLSRKAA
jgi:acyl carrier protein